MQRCVNVIGVGMSPFSPVALGPDTGTQVADTVSQTLLDAGLPPGEVCAVLAAAQGLDKPTLRRALERAGLGKVPLHALPEDEADGCSLLFQARRTVESGQAECVLVLGVQGAPAALADLDATLERHGAAAEEYMARYQARRETFAMVAVKARQHAAQNPLAPFNQPVSLDEVLADTPLAGPLTHPQFAWPSAGVAAVLLCSGRFAAEQYQGAAVRIAAQVRVTPHQVAGADALSGFAAVGYDISVAAARDLYEQAGMGPDEVGVCELHDSSTLGELLLYEALGFCREGSAEKLVEDGDNTYGGNPVINPSGGLLSLGQAPAASGLAQCIELVRHLRGSAGARQVAGARIALQHQTGVDGTVVATLYQRE